jgi:hypothetical protein
MQDVPKRVGFQVLNKSVLQVVVGSGGGKGLVQLTTKATENRIRNDMNTMVTAVGKRGGTHSVPRIIALATNALVKRGVRPLGWGAEEQLRWRSEVSAECDKIMRARIQSRAYIAAGWLWCAMEMAANVPGHGLTRLRAKDLPLHTGRRGDASKSYAKAATRSTLFAGVYNVCEGAAKVITPGMIQLAVNAETNNLRQYFFRGIGKEIKKVVKKRGRTKAA